MPVKGKMNKLSLNITPVAKAADTAPKSYVEESLESPIQILPHLYLGSSKIAESTSLLHKHKIHAILNVAKEVQTPTDGFYEAPRSAPGTHNEKEAAFELPTFTVPNSHQNKIIQIENTIESRRSSTLLQEFNESLFENSTVEYAKFNWSHYQDNFFEYLNVAFTFIEKQRKKNRNIMVHCQCGVSRSASIVIAYIMFDQKLGFHDALALVKSKSPTANPHLTFVCQLLELEKHLKSNN